MFVNRFGAVTRHQIDIILPSQFHGTTNEAIPTPCELLEHSHFSLRSHIKYLRCDDGDSQTTNGICDSGKCQGCPLVTTVCDSGTWDLSIGQCATKLPPNGTKCDSESNRQTGCHTQTEKTVPSKYMNQSMRIVRQSRLEQHVSFMQLRRTNK